MGFKRKVLSGYPRTPAWRVGKDFFTLSRTNWIRFCLIVLCGHLSKSVKLVRYGLWRFTERTTDLPLGQTIRIRALHIIC